MNELDWYLCARRVLSSHINLIITGTNVIINNVRYGYCFHLRITRTIAIAISLDLLPINIRTITCRSLFVTKFYYHFKPFVYCKTDWFAA